MTCPAYFAGLVRWLVVISVVLSVVLSVDCLPLVRKKTMVFILCFPWFRISVFYSGIADHVLLALHQQIGQRRADHAQVAAGTAPRHCSVCLVFRRGDSGFDHACESYRTRHRSTHAQGA